MNRSSQASVKRSLSLSLLLGVMLSAANVYAQDNEQSISNDPVATGISGNQDNLAADQEQFVAQQQMVSTGTRICARNGF